MCWPKTRNSKYSSGRNVSEKNKMRLRLFWHCGVLLSPACALHLSWSGACGSFYLAGGRVAQRRRAVGATSQWASGLFAVFQLQSCVSTFLGPLEQAMSIHPRRTSRTVRRYVFFESQKTVARGVHFLFVPGAAAERVVFAYLFLRLFFRCRRFLWTDGKTVGTGYIQFFQTYSCLDFVVASVVFL